MNDEVVMDNLLNDIKVLKSIMMTAYRKTLNHEKSRFIRENADKYKENYLKIDNELKILGIKNPNPYMNLDMWEGCWREKETYEERKHIVISMYDELITRLSNNNIEKVEIEYKFNKDIDSEIQKLPELFNTDFSTGDLNRIGLTCRGILEKVSMYLVENILDTSYSQSPKDIKSSFEKLISEKIPGKTNEELRKYAKGTNDLANALTHKTTPDKLTTKICINATICLLKVIEEIINI